MNDHNPMHMHFDYEPNRVLSEDLQMKLKLEARANELEYRIRQMEESKQRLKALMEEPSEAEIEETLASIRKAV